MGLAVELTVLMPCLNEARTVQACVRAARQFLDDRALDLLMGIGIVLLGQALGFGLRRGCPAVGLQQTRRPRKKQAVGQQQELVLAESLDAGAHGVAHNKTR